MDLYINSVKYPNLERLIVERGIKKSVISKKLGVSERTLYNKLKGKVEFTWSQICGIQVNFFPDISKEYLFATEEEMKKSS